MFYSRLKDQALLRIHLSQISAVYVLVGPPHSSSILCVSIVVKNELRGTDKIFVKIAKSIFLFLNDKLF